MDRTESFGRAVLVEKDLEQVDAARDSETRVDQLDRWRCRDHQDAMDSRCHDHPFGDRDHSILRWDGTDLVLLVEFVQIEVVMMLISYLTPDQIMNFLD